MREVGTALCAAALLACSSSPPKSVGSGETDAGGEGGANLSGDTVTGSVGGASLLIRGATAVVGMTARLTGTEANVALLGLTSAEGATCAGLEMTSGQLASTSTLALLILSDAPLKATTYPIASAPTVPAASAIFGVTNAQCVGRFDGGAAGVTAGSVTIASLTTSSIGGSYDLTFPEGSLKGTFSIPLCQGISLDTLFAEGSTDAAAACVSN